MDKPEKIYYFSVEGKTEKLYLKWLEKEINKNKKSHYKVFFDIIVSTQPYKRLKGIPKNEKTVLFHLCDFESQSPYHQKLFHTIIDEMAKAKSKNNVLDFKLGYSNQTFELWMILHKSDLFNAIVNRKNYIRDINKVYKKNFRGIQEYKREESFNRLLRDLDLNDVKNAIAREKAIMKRNDNLNFQLFEYKGYKYYKNNPSSTIGSIIEEILIENGLN